MEIKLTHPFLYRAQDIEKLFNGVKKLSTFLNKLENQSKLNPERYSPEKYTGDGWEFFIQALILTHQYDNRIGIFNYEPIVKNDNGVDGYGINIWGEQSAVQVKYRSNKNNLLTSGNDNLDSFITESQIAKGILMSKNYRHFIFTTAKGLHNYTNVEKFRETVKCYGYDEIRSLVDDNLHFWNFIREQITKFKINLLNSQIK